MDSGRTVTVTPLAVESALKMTWQQSVTEEDVYTAFKTINAALAESKNDLFIVVDLLNNPNFPLNATINGAIFGPYRNAKLKEWLIVGTNPTARLIARMLNSISRRDNIRWFSSEDEALTYIAQTRMDRA